MTQSEIAERCGITQGRVSQILTEYKATLPKEDVGDVLAQFDEQIRQAFKALMPQVLKGNIDAMKEMRALQAHYIKVKVLDSGWNASIAGDAVRYVVEAGYPMTEEEQAIETAALIKALTLCHGST